MQTRFLSAFLVLFMVLGLTFSYQSSWAGRVVKVKGKKVYIKLSSKEADRLSKGDKLYLVTRKSKKKKGVVVIKKIKGRKAIAKLKKGKARKRYLTRMKKRKKGGDGDSMDVAGDIASAETDVEYSDVMMGIMGSFTMMKMNVTGEERDPLDMAGAMIGAKVILDYSLTESLGLRVRAGMDMLNVSGDDEDEDTSTIKINYLVLDILGRLYLFRNQKIWSFSYRRCGDLRSPGQ